MAKSEILQSITDFIIHKNIPNGSDPTEVYNLWSQSVNIIIPDTETAVWTLNTVKQLLETDRNFLINFTMD